MFLKNLRIQEKMLTLILSMTVIIYIFSLGYIIVNVRAKSFSDAEQLTFTQAREYANLVKADINYDFDLSRGLGWALQHFHTIPPENFDDFVNPMLREFLERNPNFFSVWVSFELDALLPDYYLPYGRVRHTFVRENGNIIFQQDTLNIDGDDIGSLYHQIKLSMEETLTDPYWYSYTGREEDQILEVSPCIPLIRNNQFAGLAGTDIILDRFQDMIQEINPFDVGYALLLSNDGSYVAYPDDDILGENIGELRREYAEEYRVLERIQNGEFFSHYFYNEAMEEMSFIAYAPIYIGDTDKPWSFAVVIPRSYIVAEANNLFYRSLLVALLGLIILSIIIYAIARNITLPLGSTIETLNAIALGDIRNAKELEIKNNDEIGEMSTALNKLLQGLKNTAGFAQKIGEGNLEEDFKKLSQKDVLGEALLNMRDSLKAAREEELKRKAEDEKRNWAGQGYTTFADILRKDNDKLDELSFNVINNLVKYVGAIQGGLFILNDEDKNNRFLELVACYAYDRKKYLTRKIEMGEGLVGACFMEKKTIYMTQLPQDYVRITSGLGDENPDCLLIVPIQLNEEVYGVIELASFKPFEKHVIEFIEKVGENIASTISSVKINMRTAYLLEQSQQQAEEMRAQEEEMRQNMEEMSATQEELGRKDKEVQNYMETSEKMFCIMEYDLDGNILKVNQNFEALSGYTRSQLLGKHISIFFDNENWQQSENYHKFWDMLKSGKAVKGALRRKRADGSYYIIKGVTNAAKNEYGQIEKIVEISLDITVEAVSKDK